MKDQILQELKELQKYIISHKFEQEEIKDSYDGECPKGIFISAKGVESRVNKIINKLV